MTLGGSLTSPFNPGDSYLSWGIFPQGRLCAPQGSQTFSQPYWRFCKWEEMMGGQAEGLKALLTF